MYRIACLSTLLGSVMCTIGQASLPIVISDPDPGVGMGFGSQVAIAGDFAFVSEKEETGIFSVGSLAYRVHVFHRWEGGSNGWGWVQTIEAPDGDDISFGSGIHAWGQRLAIYRGPHTYNNFGALMCRDRTTFIYRMENSGLWVHDDALGGEIVSSGQCFYVFEGMVPGHGMDGDADVLIVKTPDNVLLGYPRLEAYRCLAPGQWVIEHAMLIPPSSSSCIAGDSLFHYLDDGSIGIQTTSGALIDTINPGASYSGGSTGSFDVSNRILVTAQPTFESMGNPSGRVLTWMLNASDIFPCDTLSEPQSQWYGRRVLLRGGRLYILEGDDTIRLFVYERDTNELCGWVLTNLISVGDGQGYRVDVNNDDTAIVSLQVSSASGDEHQYEVTIYDLSTSVGLVDRSVEVPKLIVQRNGSRVYVCSGEAGFGDDEEVSIHEVTGRQLVWASGENACANGIDLPLLSEGIYIVELRSQGQRSAVKLQW